MMKNIRLSHHGSRSTLFTHYRAICMSSNPIFRHAGNDYRIGQGAAHEQRHGRNAGGEGKTNDLLAHTYTHARIAPCAGDGGLR